jgi:hypothetical protein
MQRPLRSLLTLGLGLIALALTPNDVMGQGLEKALSATRKQREDLAPLIDVLTERIEIQMVQVDPKVIKRVLRRALEVQLTAKAVRRYQAELTRLIGMDLGLESTEELDLVSILVKESYLKSPTGREMLLTEGARPASLAADEILPPGRLEELAELRTTTRKLLDGISYPPLDVEEFHLRCVRHDKSAHRELEDLALGRVDRDQAKGMRVLSKIYGPQLAELFGSRRGTQFSKTLENTLGFDNTGVALAATLVKLRGLVRPVIYEEEGIKNEPRAICDARTLVIDRICTSLLDSPAWEQLAADHLAMLRDPKAHMALIKKRDK